MRLLVFSLLLIDEAEQEKEIDWMINEINWVCLVAQMGAAP